MGTKYSCGAYGFKIVESMDAIRRKEHVTWEQAKELST